MEMKMGVERTEDRLDVNIFVLNRQGLSNRDKLPRPLKAFDNFILFRLE